MSGESASVPPRVSVVIVSLNGRRHLERCLPALEASTVLPHEVIVVDNGSRDDTVEWLKASWPAVRLLAAGRNLGYGDANRRGIAMASAAYVALLNDDTEPTDGWIEALLAPLEADDDVAATCATLELLRWPGIVNARGGAISRLGHGWDVDFGHPMSRAPRAGAPVPTAFPTAAAALFRRADLLAHGFDRSFFMYHEDVDWGWRMWLLGRKVLYCPEALVRHAWGGTSHSARGLRWREVLGGRHAVRTMLTHLEPGNAARRVPRLLMLWVRRRAFLRLLEIVAWNVAHLPGTLVERRRLQRRRRRSDAELEALGVVAMVPIPPEPPALPRLGVPVLDPRSLVPGTTLLPARDSARGRLHAGWYRPEHQRGRAIRWTCGQARCLLRSEPGRRGTLRFSICQPPGSSAREPVTVTVNGVATIVTPAGSGFSSHDAPALADERGLLEVAVESRAVVPFLAGGSWDVRSLGVGVERIGFVGEAAGAPPPDPSVSVVIPTYNRKDALLRTLEALREQRVPPTEVIVVDDGSADDTASAAEAWMSGSHGPTPIRVLRQDNAGPGAARNRGVAAATGDLVLFLGDDTTPDSDLVAEHLAAHRALAEPAAVVGFTDWDRGRMRVTPFLEHANNDGAQFAYGLFAHGDDLPFTCLYTSNLSVPRAVLGPAPFSPEFRHAAWEDCELGYRLSLRGVRIVLWATARARHFHPMTMAGFLRRQQRVGTAVHTLYRLHPELLDDPVMPSPHPPRWFPLGRLVVPLLIPFVNALDSARVHLPAVLYRGLLSWAYHSRRLRPRDHA
ncbi:MAG: glycosyltransferase family 2 protein [Acidobacteriota bacterium]